MKSRWRPIEISIDPMTTCENHPRDGSGRVLEHQHPLLGVSLSVGQMYEQVVWWGLGCHHTMCGRRPLTEMTWKKVDVDRRPQS